MWLPCQIEAVDSPPEAPPTKWRGALLPRRRGLGRAVVGFATASLALAAAALPEDADQPIHWRADQAEGDMAGRTILTGAVRMEQGTLQVDADRMVIEYEGDAVVRVVAEGKPAHYRQTLRADGGPVEADAAKIIYHASEERIELIGEARLTQARHEFRGEVIQYNFRAGIIDAVDERDGVRMVWAPEEERGVQTDAAP